MVNVESRYLKVHVDRSTGHIRSKPTQFLEVPSAPVVCPGAGSIMQPLIHCSEDLHAREQIENCDVLSHEAACVGENRNQISRSDPQVCGCGNTVVVGSRLSSHSVGGLGDESQVEA